MKRLLQRQLETRGASVRERDGIAHAFQVVLHKAAKAHIVFDQQKASEGRGFRGHGFL